MSAEKHQILQANEGLITKWLAERGGVAVWQSQDLGNPGRGWTTPVNDENGVAYTRPHWSCGQTPDRVITDASEVEVIIPAEFKRFHVGLKQRGFSTRVTDGGTRKIKAALSEAGEGAWYEFDGQDAVIYRVAAVRGLSADAP